MQLHVIVLGLGVVDEIAIRGSSRNFGVQLCVNDFAGSVEVYVQRVDRLGRNLCVRQVYGALPNGIQLGAVHSHIGSDCALHRCGDAAGFGKFTDVDVVSIEPHLNRAGVCERPLAQTCADIESYAPAVGRIEFTIRKTRLRGTCVDIGAQQLPLRAVNAQIGGVERSIEMWSGHGSANGPVEVCCAV